jgi:hypothetical protein
MRRALWEYVISWVGGRLNPSAADSTKDNARTLAFLNSRWSEAAVVDLVDVGEKTFVIKMHGKHAPVVCLVVERSSSPSCFNTDR